MKKLLCMLIPVLLLGMTAFAAPSDWAVAEVEEAVLQGFVPAYFNENWQANITRAEFAEIAVHFLAAKLSYAEADFAHYVNSQPYKVNTYTNDTALFMIPRTESGTFTDTDSPYVWIAANIGIVTGRGNGIFDPDTGITRQEAALMLLRTYAAYSYSLSFDAQLTFADAAEIAPWASLGVRFATKEKVMQGTSETTFSPLASYTREQAVLTFLRLGQNTEWMQNPGFYRAYTPAGTIEGL